MMTSGIAIIVNGFTPYMALAFGNPSESGAAAWCGARQRGMSIDEANRQLRRTMSAQLMMSTDFASAIVGLMNNRQGMQSQIDYYISKMCPNMLHDNRVASGQGLGQQGSQGSPSDEPSIASFCGWSPWDPKCKATASGSNNLPANSTQLDCAKVLIRHECSYQKYLLANPSVAAWAKANPAMAKAEALNLKAIDAESFGGLQNKPVKPVQKTSSEKSVTEEKCLKAADFKGCMEYYK